MRSYELVIVVKPSLIEKERKKLLETVKSWLTEMKVTGEKDLGSKALKYRIKKELTGFYYDFLLEGEKIPIDFEKKLFTSEGILRHLVIRKK
jgi:ribosomal protein S6